jgi:NAD(P)-dependent dehydrogenase (short-subunit alcohol dehydrogenase family)
MQDTKPKTPTAARAPFFQNDTFYKLYFPVGIYYTIANFALLFFKIPVAKLAPNDCFQLEPSSPSPVPVPVAIVTGSNTGIGYETASSLVERGYQVILACRDEKKGKKAAQDINSKIGNKKECGEAIFEKPLDLSSMASVRTFSDYFSKKYNHLNVLVNNAGINFTGASVDGLDLCFQTNFLGHFLLTKLLMNKLLNAKNKLSDGRVEAGRVVNLSSVCHHFASPCEERKGGSGSNSFNADWWRDTATINVSQNTYKESKLASLIFTHELNKRFGAKGLRAVSCNPGAVNSDIWRNYPASVVKIFKRIYLNSKQGSSTSLAAAIGNVPEGAIYLQPYLQPFSVKEKLQRGVSSFRRWYSTPHPLFEMLGPYVGYAVTEPRLPDNIDDVCGPSMWEVSDELVGLKKID